MGDAAAAADDLAAAVAAARQAAVELVLLAPLPEKLNVAGGRALSSHSGTVSNVDTLTHILAG